MDIQTDTRGLGLGLITFIAIIVLFGIFYSLANPVVDSSLSTASTQADDQTAKDAISLRQDIWTYTPFAVLLLAGLFLTARAVFESGRV